MSWYDLFSGFYDRSLEPLYREQRRLAGEALALAPGQVVLDLPCGTGQSFDVIAPRIGPEGALLGVDLSKGMLERAAARAKAAGWTQVQLLQRDVHGLDAAAVEQALGRPRAIDRLHIFLGLTAFPEWQRAFEHLWSMLAPGGRCVIVDVHAAKPDLQGRMVNLVARADIRRETWTVLERIASNYSRVELPSQKQHGGLLFLASGDKPR
ncbi:MAG TPA: methyltransferase domain-containing protein [Enhygromyxa sp.]|nr:methyltransferase domain-containing protein [Enhygromyxa sp.]